MGGKTSSSSSGDKTTIGYKYYIGYHLVFCYGPVDAILELTVADKHIFNGNITTSTSIYVDKPQLFGGEDREGGVVGWFDILMGTAAQVKNTYLTSLLGTAIPAYRGVVSVIAKKVYAKAYSPYFDTVSGLLKRTNIQTNGEAQWYVAKASIGGDLNPVHIIRECLTNSEWGMGYPVSAIDDTNFAAAADVLYTEQFGLSLKWSQMAEIQEFINIIQEHVDLILYQDAFTAKFKIRLIRDDYVVDDLIVFNDDNATIKDYKKASWGETINELTVVFTDVTDKGKAIPVTVQDLGNIRMQGAIVRQKKHYPGITNQTLAIKVALRDLTVLSSALSILSIVVNRDAWDLDVGSPFVFTWPKYSVSGQVFRVTKINKGALTDNKILIEAVEDRFSLAVTSYLEVQENLWAPSNNAPAPVKGFDIYTAGFWDINQFLSNADIAALDENAAALVFNTTFETGDTFNCEIRVNGLANNLINENTKTAVSFAAPFCKIGVAIDQKTTVLSITDEQDMDNVVVSDTDYLKVEGESALAEIMKLVAVDIVARTITVERGCLDTTPRPHAIGTNLWFPTISSATEKADRFANELVYIKMLPITIEGRYEVGTEGSYDTAKLLTDRYNRPYPPGNLRIDGNYYPSEPDGTVAPYDIVITWNHRDRTLNLGPLIGHADTNDSGDGTEIGWDAPLAVTYIVTVTDTDGPTQLFQANVGSAKTCTYNHTSIYTTEIVVDVDSYIDFGGPDQFKCLNPASITLTLYDAAGLRTYWSGQGKTGYELEVFVSSPITYLRNTEASGNTLDEAGSNDATNVGITTLTPSLISTDIPNKSHAHTTTNSYSNIVTDATLDDIRCAELWIKPTVLTGNDCILSRFNSNVGEDGWSLYFNAAGNLLFHAKDGVTSVVYRYTTTSPIVVSNVYHIVVNFGYLATDLFQIFINNTLVVNTTMGGTFTQGAHELRVGRATDPWWDDFTGNIDEVAFYGRSLSAAEVDLHYIAATV